MGRKGRRILVVLCRGHARRGRVGFCGIRGAPGRSGHHLDVGLDRRHLPADRSRLVVQDDSRGREGVLRLHQRPRRGQRSQDQLHHPRRRVRPVQDGAADAAARRAGPRVRRLRQPRHGPEPRDLELPQQRESAAGRSSRRATRTGASRRRSTRGRSAGSRTIRARARSTASTSRRTCRTRRSACSTRTTPTARTTTRASASGSAPRRARSSVPSPTT